MAEIEDVLKDHKQQQKVRSVTPQYDVCSSLCRRALGSGTESVEAGRLGSFGGRVATATRRAVRCQSSTVSINPAISARRSDMSTLKPLHAYGRPKDPNFVRLSCVPLSVRLIVIYDQPDLVSSSSLSSLRLGDSPFQSSVFCPSLPSVVVRRGKPSCSMMKDAETAAYTTAIVIVRLWFCLDYSEPTLKDIAICEAETRRKSA